MRTLKRITIIGGGLAGLTLGIGLRRRGIPVTVFEAGHYPRHRVCGEFVSGGGQDVLESLELGQVFRRAGAGLTHTAAFFFERAASPVRRLSPPALCLSRLKMDALLAGEFTRWGGELREHERSRADQPAEGVVRASGRRLQPLQTGRRWLGLKVHARKVSLLADLEMHSFPNGYVGLCRLPDDEVNVCGLFRRPAAPPGARASWQQLLRGPPGTLLRERLAPACLDEGSFCAVAGFTLRPERAAPCPECRIGDALTMIPPVTGNGMSMAFESAALALAPLTAWSRGELPWAEARQSIARACDDAFAPRLAWAQWLQRLMFAPWLHTARLAPLVLRSDRLWRFLFTHTR